MLPPYVVLDLETTGGSPTTDRIIEIALIRFEEGVETGRWQTLVNPGVSISPFISRLTGITDAMVRDAPMFEEIAATLYSFLEGAVLAAHNARFDHGFLKCEYRRLGATLRQRVMCTVKLSRRLYPEHRSHSLDAIMARHGLSAMARHRAMGDVELVVDYLAHARRELGEARVLAAVNDLLRGPALPAGLDAGFLDEIPEGPGVYLFYGDNDLPLYIGKSVALRSRVLSHFSGDHACSKDMRIGQEIRRVEWIETAGELGALLLESRLIKELQPIHNRRLRRTRSLFSLRLADRPGRSPLIALVAEEDIQPDVFDHLHGLFHTKAKAVETLREIVRAHRLCPRIVGLESGRGPCFAYQIKRCAGACAGKEPLERHYLRLEMALVPYRLQGWPYPGRIGIREHDETSGRTQVHLIDHWCHVGTAGSERELHDELETHTLKFDLDTYKLLQKHLKKHPDVIPCHVQRPPLPEAAAGLLRSA
ncbi:exonuclease domain-containing protein [Nitrosovibrio sp. Nv17]|uniref:exonuclease domain-containing protein n=1 Tax=Nitrosovibrio sp. Nv17 TaxID=1855339 RepID=UPI00090886AE|nr:exonuclease domain-containing protein [Nitrosovibrio sp. Nv17]SFW25772.1 DNA polymerase-3 subunit epsilon [Nitrosovibrio sp. Nv17]